MSNDLTKPEEPEGTPLWARKSPTTSPVDNIDSSDLRPPRLKLLAPMSPEITNGTPGATPGNFWLTVFNQNLGKEVIVTMIKRHKSYHVWAPKTAGSEQRGPLASASDGIHWDVPNQTFEIKFPNNPQVYKWRIGKLVSDFGATKFGTQQPENPKSKPIATKTFDLLFMVELPDGARQMCLFTAARTGVTPTETLFSTMQTRPEENFYQRYLIVATKRNGPTGDPYFSYEFQFVGRLSEEEGRRNKALVEQYRSATFAPEIDEEAPPAPPPGEPEQHHYDEKDEIPF